MGRLFLVGLFLALAGAAHGQETPSEVVARMARQAMGGSDGPEVWQALASALPDLALKGSADLAATFEAARVADSISAASAAVASMSAAGAPGRAEGWAGVPPGSLFLWGGAGFLALLGMTAARSRRRAGREAAASVPTEVVAVAGRVGTARSLLTSGLTADEVARRTGMAREAVEVLVALTHGRALAGTEGATRSGGPSPQRARGRGRYGAVPLGRTTARRDRPDEERLRREAREAARRLRDRRLVYGPGSDS